MRRLVSSVARLTRLQRDLPQREPACHVLLPRQLVGELGLESELALRVAALLAGGDEGGESAALEVVDQVERLALSLEGEHRRQQPVAVATPLELGGNRVERHHQVLELAVAQDQPAVAELVV